VSRRLSLGGDNAEFTNAPFSGGAINPTIPHSDREISNGANAMVAPMGEAQIMRQAKIASNPKEFDLASIAQHVKYVQCFNRAEKGHVKTWCSSFNGRVYPEGAEAGKHAWLKPGESMQLTIEEALHFFGNFFNPNPPRSLAVDLIERYGGFELEAKREYARNDAPRIVGGPIGLPDMVVQPMNSRMKPVGNAIAIYDLYYNATSNLIRKPTGKDPELQAEERELLLQRLEEYQVGDEDEDEDDIPEAFCDCNPIQHTRGVIGCAHNVMTAKAVLFDPPAKRGRKPAADEEITLED